MSSSKAFRMPGPGFAVALITLLSLYVRLMPALRAGFPINDGGLFYRMIEDLRLNVYLLPTYTTYNAADIPFAYPPLGFYLAGSITDLTGMHLLDVLRL